MVEYLGNKELLNVSKTAFLASEPRILEALLARFYDK